MSLAPAARSRPLATKAFSSSIPPGALTGALTIARPCMVAPVFFTENITSPALAVVVSDLTHISPSVVLTIAPMPALFALAGCFAPPASGPATFGAPVVCRIPAAPRTMSPKAWVTNGKLPSWSSVNSTHPPAGGQRDGLRVVADHALDVGLVEDGAHDVEGAPLARACVQDVHAHLLAAADRDRARLVL